MNDDAGTFAANFAVRVGSGRRGIATGIQFCSRHCRRKVTGTGSVESGMDVPTGDVVHRDDVRCDCLLLECVAPELFLEPCGFHHFLEASYLGDDLYSLCRAIVGPADREGCPEGRRRRNPVSAVTLARNCSVACWCFDDPIRYPGAESEGREGCHELL